MFRFDLHTLPRQEFSHQHNGLGLLGRAQHLGRFISGFRNSPFKVPQGRSIECPYANRKIKRVRTHLSECRVGLPNKLTKLS